jgi:hypothetical protein
MCSTVVGQTGCAHTDFFCQWQGGVQHAELMLWGTGKGSHMPCRDQHTTFTTSLTSLLLPLPPLLSLLLLLLRLPLLFCCCCCPCCCCCCCCSCCACWQPGDGAPHQPAAA